LKNKILITGITGFVGSYFKSNLTSDYDISGVSRKSSLNSITYDQLRKSTFDKTFAFIHLAGKVHDLKKTHKQKEYFEVNTELTRRLFDAFLQSDCPLFIYMSSVKAVADSVEGVLSEDILPVPITSYGKSKLAAEDYILSQEVPNTKRVYVLRPCMIHGPNNKGNLSLLYSIVLKGVPYPLGAFENKRSFCSIDNLIFVFKELIEREDIPSGVYNVSDDIPLSTNDVISILAESLNRKPRIWNVSKSLIQLGAKIGNILHLPLNEERLQKLTESYVVSNNKLMDAIGKPLPVSSREGLLKTFQSFQ
jgi:nucleoside-diphosphate-sugar epimerase